MVVYQRVKTLTCCCVVVGVPESEDTDVLLCCCWCTRQLCEKLTVGEDIDGELQSLKVESEQFSTLLDEVRSISLLLGRIYYSYFLRRNELRTCQWLLHFNTSMFMCNKRH